MWRASVCGRRSSKSHRPERARRRCCREWRPGTRRTGPQLLPAAEGLCEVAGMEHPSTSAEITAAFLATMSLLHSAVRLSRRHRQSLAVGAIIAVRVSENPPRLRSHMPRGKQLDPSILQAALAGLEFQRQRLDQQIAKVEGLLAPARRKPTAAQEPAKPRRTMSLAARRRISAAQKRRWAQLKKSQQAKKLAK